MRLVVGLGNPGREYEATRHNVGFMVVDEVARRLSLSTWRKKDNARQLADTTRDLVLVEPLSYMNLSGGPVRKIAAWYRTPPEQMLVIGDDMDLPFGRLRLRLQGGHGGHNGLRSLIEHFGAEFPRLRVGVGRPEYDSIDHVLSPFDATEREALPLVIGAAADAVERWLGNAVEEAMRVVNAWKLNPEA